MNSLGPTNAEVQLNGVKAGLGLHGVGLREIEMFERRKRWPRVGERFLLTQRLESD